MNDLAPLIDRVRTALASEPSMREVRMFGGLSFMVNEKMVVAVGREGDLLVRIDPKQNQEFLERPGTVQAEMGAGRSMGPGWVHVHKEALTTEDDLAFWVSVALEHNAPARGGSQ
ncbi:TfoX/Sxy family protein [Nesterenkonia marinintestina]|uniref:TfoX/Sxy family protein n=1 Tax=Nesterenkonia marinintestina TaxID=2979865 RepID=UPI0021C14815|nr:TfoX/Sxy family protein [Nesterenkonia sp. GX14115]